MNNTIIIAAPILFSDERMLRLGVVEADGELTSYDGHYAEIYARIAQLIEVELQNESLVFLTTSVFSSLGDDEGLEVQSVEDLVEYILESDPMTYFLSDLRKKWDVVNPADIDFININQSNDRKDIVGMGGNIDFAKEVLKETDLMRFLEVLSMYLDT